MEELKKCPFSGEYFKSKRSNQIFASKRNRISYYNREYRKKRLPLERINRRLFYNYSILEIVLSDKDIVYLNIDYLKGKGFDFTFFTHFMNFNNETYFGLYDIAFRQLDNNNIQIERNEADSSI
jgi:hypothetical protein